MDHFPQLPQLDEALDIWRKRYPGTSDEELRQAKENLQGYFSVLWRIACRLEAEGRLDQILTESRKHPTMQERSNPPNHQPIQKTE